MTHRIFYEYTLIHKSTVNVVFCQKYFDVRYTPLDVSSAREIKLVAIELLRIDVNRFMSKGTLGLWSANISELSHAN